MNNAYRLTEDAVDAYEAEKVTSIFAPLAEATLAKFAIDRNERCLDVACGTGIMARIIRRRFGPSVAITGIDLNDMMIAKARSMAGDLPGCFDWHVCDVTDIPVPPSEFDYVFCQQGVQYFPDVAGALEEMCRILATGGKLVLTVWASPNAYFLAQSAAMEKFVSPKAAEKALAPFSFPAARVLPSMLKRVGLGNVVTEKVTIERVIADASNGIREDILGSPLRPMVEAKGPHTLTEVVNHILSECAGFMRNGDLIIPQTSEMFVASYQSQQGH